MSIFHVHVHRVREDGLEGIRYLQERRVSIPCKVQSTCRCGHVKWVEVTDRLIRRAVGR